MRLFLNLLVALLLTVATPAHATSVIKLDVAAHVADSTAVVEGIVGPAVTTADPKTGRPVTATTVTVKDTWHGKAPTTFAVLQVKGALNGQHTFIPGDGDLREGAHVVLFVAQHGDRFYLAALAQSVYEVVGNGDGAAVVQHLDGLNMFQRDASGQLQVVHDRVVPAQTLGELRAEVRAAVEGSR